jgi:hypothetical protein
MKYILYSVVFIVGIVFYVLLYNKTNFAAFVQATTNSETQIGSMQPTTNLETSIEKTQKEWWDDLSQRPPWLDEYIEIREKELLKDPSEQNVEIVSCERGCSGLGDQQKGALSVLARAILDKRAFFIDVDTMKHWAGVTGWGWNWTLPHSLRDTYKQLAENGSSNIHISNGGYFLRVPEQLKKFKSDVERLKWHMYFPQHDLTKEIEQRENKLVYEYQLCTSYDKLIGALARALIQPGPLVQNAVDKFVGQHFNDTKPVLGMHVRHPKNEKRSVEDKGHALKTKEDLEMYSDCFKLYDSKVGKIFIATDWDYFREYAEQKWGKDRIIRVEGKTGHSVVRPNFKQEARKTTVDFFIRLWLDFFLFEQVDVLLGTTSGFSRMATYRKGFCPHGFANSDVYHVYGSYGTPCTEEFLFPSLERQDPQHCHVIKTCPPETEAK